MTDLNPQAKQMADESMVRNLRAQADAIWPQERRLFARYELPQNASILDAGCGTGEIASRLAQAFPGASVLGVDIVEEHLELARGRYRALAPRLRFAAESIFELSADDGAFDLTVCRHVLHAVPFAERVIAELVRVTRPGGYVHLLVEDYGMLQFQKGNPDPRDFWYRAVPEFAAATSTDLFIGRNSYGILKRLGLEDVAVEYAIVDTARVERKTFAGILEAWRDGYCEAIGEHTSVSAAEATAYFDRMIANVRDPEGYAVWFAPIVSARLPLHGLRGDAVRS